MGIARLAKADEQQLVALVALLLAALVSCGVPLDGEPRAISVSTTTTSTTVVPSDDPRAPRVSLYFLDEDHLAVQSFAVEGDPTYASVEVDALFHVNTVLALTDTEVTFEARSATPSPPTARFATLATTASSSGARSRTTVSAGQRASSRPSTSPPR